MCKIKIFNNLNSKGTIFVIYIIVTVVLLIFFLTSSFWFPDTSDLVSEDYGNTFEANDYYIKVDNAHYDTENKLLTFEYFIKAKIEQTEDSSDEDNELADIDKFQSYNASVDVNDIEKQTTEDESSGADEVIQDEVEIPISSFPTLSYIIDEKHNKLNFTSQKDEKLEYKFYCSAELEKKCKSIMIYFTTTKPQYSELDSLDEFGNTIKGEVHDEETLYFYSKIDFRDITVGKNNSVIPVPTTSQAPTTTTTVTTTQTSSVTTTAATINSSVVEKNKTAAEKAMKQAKFTKLSVKSSSKKKISASWKKVNKAVGYEVKVSANKSFKKVIFNKDTNKTKLTITNNKIKSKKTYYLRVRAYATYQNAYGKIQKVYSKWNNKLGKVKVK